MEQKVRAYSISVQIKKLANMRQRVMPDTKKFIELFNDALMAHGKSIDAEGLENLEKHADCDLVVAETYGKILGSHMRFKSVSYFIGENPKRRINRVKNIIERCENDIAYLNEVDLDSGTIYRVMVTKKSEPNEKPGYSVDVPIGSLYQVEFEHVRLGMMRIVQKMKEDAEEELEDLTHRLKQSAK